MSQEFEVFTSSAVQKQSRSCKEKRADAKYADPEFRAVVAEFIQAPANGALKGVRRACGNFLPGGQFHPDTAAPMIMPQLDEFPTTSDKIESVFALLYLYMLNYRDRRFLSLSGMTICRANNTFTRFLGRPETRPELKHFLVYWVGSNVPEYRRAAIEEINEITVQQRRDQTAKANDV